MYITIGIDIGGTNTAYGIVNQAGEVLLKGSLPTAQDLPIEAYIAGVYQTIETQMESLEGDYELVGVGVGAPNGNHHLGAIDNASNLRWKGIVPIAELFGKHYDVPVVLDNDANAATIGEMVYGNAKGMSDFMVITLGTGVGSGIVSNGELIHGHDGFAGELGHTIVMPGGRECTCGRKGCLEAYVAARGIVQTAKKLISTYEEVTSFKPEDTITPKSIWEAAEKGDPLALRTFEKTAEMLGLKLADAVAYTSPKAIFLLGGISAAGGYLFDPVKKHLEANIHNLYQNKVDILPSGLPNGNAAILGAAALVSVGEPKSRGTEEPKS